MLRPPWAPAREPSWLGYTHILWDAPPCPGLSIESEQGPGASLAVPAHVPAAFPQDLIRVHHSFLRAIDVAMMAGGGTLAKVFLEFKERWVRPSGCGASGRPGASLGPSRTVQS